MKISIIVPVYNEEKLISGCLEALINQKYPKEDYEIVAVNDGSSDGTANSIAQKKKEAETKGVVLRLINLKNNKGRVIAREEGAKNAEYDNLLFIDSRCHADAEILEKNAQINYQPIIGNPIVDFNRSIFDRFGWLARKKLYRGSFGENFKPFYIDKNNFNGVAKGTGVFFCDKNLFFSSQLAVKDRNVSDDTKLLWNIVQQKKILKHPDVKATYLFRTSFKGVMKHTFERGPKFADYYLNIRQKYFWIFIFLPIFAALLTVVFIFVDFNYFLCWLVFLFAVLLILSLWLSENSKDFFIMIILLPLFTIAFSLGIIKGLAFKLIGKH
ncbi:glycosyltransferase family 2 protein [Candidatus Wolfebacteria bacterium]|nr:glycosyltransferase family 2 protein [Candidatus Wolfebacteria bacterium]